MKVKYLLPAFLWSAIILFIIGIPGSNIPSSSLFEIPHFDKMIHAGIFGVLSLLLCYGFFRQGKKPFSAGFSYTITIAICVIYGGLTEMYQHFYVAGRSGDFLDFVANISGSLAGMLFFYYIRRNPQMAAYLSL